MFKNAVIKVMFETEMQKCLKKNVLTDTKKKHLRDSLGFCEGELLPVFRTRKLLIEEPS